MSGPAKPPPEQDEAPRAEPEQDEAQWFVYVLKSTTLRRTYVGVTTDPSRRLEQHNGERAGGARSTRAGRPWEQARLHGPYATRGEAQRLERLLKQRRGDARLLPLPTL